MRTTTAPSGSHPSMNFRRLGRTELLVSAIGFGTCQLRMVSESQAVESLRRAIELGVNLIHTAPDYEGALELVAEACRESGHDVIVCCQGYDRHYHETGPVDHFKRLFETTCELLGKNTLDLFGIACIDDREAFRENVWGRNGMVEFLQRKKDDGRVRGIFCTTHGSPSYIKRLLETNVFDALMLAYNVLGFHLLSHRRCPDEDAENLARMREEIFPLVRRQDIGLMIMKPLAGGLLCRGRALPAHAELPSHKQNLAAGSLLRAVLRHPEVTCVVPGTTSVEEASENALAGYGALDTQADSDKLIDAAMDLLRTELCSRCGACDSLCSRGLPISWLFRAAYVGLHPAAAFETWDEVEYFRLLPALRLACEDCTEVSCACPFGLDIPNSLKSLHHIVLELEGKGLVRGKESLTTPDVREPFAGRVLFQHIPQALTSGSRAGCRICVENLGQEGWFAAEDAHKARVQLLIAADWDVPRRLNLRQDTHPGGRAHFAFDLAVPERPGVYRLSLILLSQRTAFSPDAGVTLYNGSLHVTRP